LDDSVKKIPLSVDCVNFAYDITEKQPQLFVARDFGHLGEVLEDLTVRLSYRRGGAFGLERAREAGTVNTVQLNSGLQISGTMKDFLLTGGAHALPAYLQFEGPSQLAVNYQELAGQGCSRHPQGFSSPLGLLRNHQRCLSTYKLSELRNLALNEGERARLQFESGVLVEGILRGWTYNGDRLILLTWSDCRVTWEDKVLFDPSWGEYDMAVGSEVTSVFGGPADRSRYGETEDFAAKRVPVRAITAQEKERHAFYQDIRDLREGKQTPAVIRWQKLTQRFLISPVLPWLIGLELAELSYQIGVEEAERAPLLEKLGQMTHISMSTKQCIHDGLKMARQKT
jgi:phenylalanine-4-hydroxylase